MSPAGCPAYDGHGGGQDHGQDGLGIEDELSRVPVDGPETVAEQRLLASLGRRARTVNLARVVRLAELLDRADAGVLDEAGRSEAENLAHQVIGSAGTFGHPDASVDAAAVEAHFAAARGAQAPGTTTEVRRRIERLRAEFGG